MGSSCPQVLGDREKARVRELRDRTESACPRSAPAQAAFQAAGSFSCV